MQKKKTRRTLLATLLALISSTGTSHGGLAKKRGLQLLNGKAVATRMVTKPILRKVSQKRLLSAAQRRKALQRLMSQRKSSDLSSLLSGKSGVRLTSPSVLNTLERKHIQTFLGTKIQRPLPRLTIKKTPSLHAEKNASTPVPVSQTPWDNPATFLSQIGTTVRNALHEDGKNTESWKKHAASIERRVARLEIENATLRGQLEIKKDISQASPQSHPQGFYVYPGQFIPMQSMQGAWPATQQTIQGIGNQGNNSHVYNSNPASNVPSSSAMRRSATMPPSALYTSTVTTGGKSIAELLRVASQGTPLPLYTTPWFQNEVSASIQQLIKDNTLSIVKFKELTEEQIKFVLKNEPEAEIRTRIHDVNNCSIEGLSPQAKYDAIWKLWFNQNSVPAAPSRPALPTVVTTENIENEVDNGAPLRSGTFAADIFDTTVDRADTLFNPVAGGLASFKLQLKPWYGRTASAKKTLIENTELATIKRNQGKFAYLSIDELRAVLTDSAVTDAALKDRIDSIKKLKLDSCAGEPGKRRAVFKRWFNLGAPGGPSIPVAPSHGFSATNWAATMPNAFSLVSKSMGHEPKLWKEKLNPSDAEAWYKKLPADKQALFNASCYLPTGPLFGIKVKRFEWLRTEELRTVMQDSSLSAPDLAARRDAVLNNAAYDTAAAAGDDTAKRQAVYDAWFGIGVAAP